MRKNYGILYPFGRLTIYFLKKYKSYILIWIFFLMWFYSMNFRYFPYTGGSHPFSKFFFFIEEFSKCGIDLGKNPIFLRRSTFVNSFSLFTFFSLTYTLETICASHWESCRAPRASDPVSLLSCKVSAENKSSYDS